VSYAGENPYEGIDPNDEVAIEKARFNASLRDAQERRSILDAINLANGLQHEIAGETPGLILHYLRDMRDQAIQAMADLISKPGMEEKERIAAQLAVQPYAHLMQWLKTKVAVGRGARAEIHDLDDFLDGKVED
jgi:hypothetical protein